MKSLFGLTVLLPMMRATGSSGSSGVCEYEVLVSNAKDLIDEDMDINLGFYKKENYNDVYVDVIGYGLGGDDKQKTLRTTTIDESETPEWNERFAFSNADEQCGDGYDKWLMQLWDNDVIGDWGNNWDADFLGETRFIDADEIKECDKIYSFELEVTRDDEEAGTLFVEFTKTGCCDGEETKEEEEYDEEVKKEEEEEKEEEQETKTKGKEKGRRLLA